MLHGLAMDMVGPFEQLDLPAAEYEWIEGAIADAVQAAGDQANAGTRDRVREPTQGGAADADRRPRSGASPPPRRNPIGGPALTMHFRPGRGSMSTTDLDRETILTPAIGRRRRRCPRTARQARPAAVPGRVASGPGPGDRIRSGPHRTQAGRISPSSRRPRRPSSCCCSMRTTRGDPVKVIDLDPADNRTFYFWHIYVKDVKPGMGYAYRVDGPRDLHGRGHRFNPRKVLIDPYGRAVTSTLWDRAAACGPDDNVTSSLSSIVVDTNGYDWEGDRPINRPMSQTVIYEMHVKGFTQSPSSGAKHPGTYAGVIEKIPYLKSLGVTAVELMPVFEFDETEISGVEPDHRPAARQLLGLQPDRLLQPARRLLRPARRGQPHPRVPGHGQGPPQGRHRGHPRRRVQPHRRGQPRGAHDQLPRPRQRHVLPPRAGQAVLHEPDRAAGTRSTATTR